MNPPDWITEARARCEKAKVAAEEYQGFHAPKIWEALEDESRALRLLGRAWELREAVATVLDGDERVPGQIGSVAKGWLRAPLAAFDAAVEKSDEAQS